MFTLKDIPLPGGATCGAGTSFPFGTLEFTLGFSGVGVALSLALFVVFCRLLLVFFSSVLSVFRFTASYYPFGTSNLSYYTVFQLLELNVQCQMFMDT